MNYLTDLLSTDKKANGKHKRGNDVHSNETLQYTIMQQAIF